MHLQCAKVLRWYAAMRCLCLCLCLEWGRRCFPSLMSLALVLGVFEFVLGCAGASGTVFWCCLLLGGIGRHGSLLYFWQCHQRNKNAAALC
jgi:hypothetical protein